MPRFPEAVPAANSLSDRVFSSLAAKARARTGKTYPLHVGDTWREPLEAARAEAQRTDDTPHLHTYSPVEGEPELVEAILARLKTTAGKTFESAEVQVMSGATAGLSVVTSTLLGPGDEVLLPAPYWPLIRGIVVTQGAVPVEIPFFDRIGADFDPEAALEEAVSDRTVAVYVNTPNNPTGVVLDADTLAAIVRVAQRHDLWIISDEAYEDLHFGPRPKPFWTGPVQERTLVTHTLSKSYGLAGARVGYVHGPAGIMKAVRGVQTFTTYCASRPMQLGAARALNEGDGWIAEARVQYEAAGRRAAQVVGVDAPAAGTFLFFDASPHFREGEDTLGFLERCLEAGVLMTPGAACGGDYLDWVRLCFTSVPPDELEEALARLATVLGETE